MSDDVQSGTVIERGSPYTLHIMQTEYAKATLIGIWILVAGSIGVGLGVTSIAGWAALAVLSLAPPAAMLRFSGAPSPSMSETIGKVLR
jgi:hypothetical protein